MLHTILLVIYNLCRFIVGKALHGYRYQVHPLQRISPGCHLKLFGHGTLTIGRNTSFEAGCDLQVHGNGKLTIGDGTYMNKYCMISAHERVNIGRHCMFGPSVKIFDNNHQYSAETGVSPKLTTDSITIGDNCWIASNVIILKGATIGDNCVIGAGCVISGTIPSGHIVKAKQEQEVKPIIH